MSMSADGARPWIAALLAASALACERPFDGAPGGWSEEELRVLFTLVVPDAPPPSPSNRYADDPRAAELGRTLFFDAGLSADGSISCASCHKPSLYFTDGQPRAVGLAPVERHTPSVIGAAWYPFVAWDGRKDSLWSQALGPIEGAEEMGSHRLLAVHEVAARHRDAYERVFGPLPALPEGLAGMNVADAHSAWDELDESEQERITSAFVNIGKAIEAYERRLQPGVSPFDRYVAALRSGDPEGGGHLTPEAVRGLAAFLGDASCIHCHNGPLFTDGTFHNVGVPSDGGEPDPGRKEGIPKLLADPFRSDGVFSDHHENPELTYLDPDFADTAGAFKTPSLRNVAKTAPYGHAGHFGSLSELLEFYKEDHHEAPALGHRDPLLDLVDTDFSATDMEAFLCSLTGPLPDAHWLSAPEETR